MTRRKGLMLEAWRSIWWETPGEIGSIRELRSRMTALEASR
jgi:hypothetical protein